MSHWPTNCPKSLRKRIMFGGDLLQGASIWSIIWWFVWTGYSIITWLTTNQRLSHSFQRVTDRRWIDLIFIYFVWLYFLFICVKTVASRHCHQFLGRQTSEAGNELSYNDRKSAANALLYALERNFGPFTFGRNLNNKTSIISELITTSVSLYVFCLQLLY